jgi:N-acetylglucosaminyl-diphospho-decaprenol L-rhamnosyltransferase
VEQGRAAVAVIDVVIVTADSRELVLDCLAHVESSRVDRTIVVDNAGSDGSAAAIAATFPAITVVRLDEPRPLSFAYNRGAEAGSAGAILFLNDDVFPSPGAIDALAAALEEARNAVAAAGRLVDPDDGVTQREYLPRPFPTLATFLAALLGVNDAWPTNPWTGRHLRHPLDETATAVVDYAPGACLLVLRPAFDALGGWDERYVFWYEDVDLARRLRRFGQVLYVPTAVFRHVGGHSARKLSCADVLARSHSGVLRYGEAHLVGWRRRLLGAAFALSSTVKAPLARRRDPELAGAYRSVRQAGLRLARGLPLDPGA